MKVAELFETNDIGSRVRQSLKNAIDNGYGNDFKKMSAEEIAADLQRYSSELENVDVKEIVPHVKAWYKRRRTNESTLVMDNLKDILKQVFEKYFDEVYVSMGEDSAKVRFSPINPSQSVKDKIEAEVKADFKHSLKYDWFIDEVDINL